MAECSDSPILKIISIIMKPYFAYTRVSTPRQGEGVSLQEQRRSILEYAAKHGISVTDWIEEQESAAHHGRPRFTNLLSLLKSKPSAGLIIHKIDRCARNLRDWADIVELMDRGIEVHFARESLDLHTRSGRLSEWVGTRGFPSGDPKK
jgi:site-specific DNA recombinase